MHNLHVRCKLQACIVRQVSSMSRVKTDLFKDSQKVAYVGSEIKNYFISACFECAQGVHCLVHVHVDGNNLLPRLQKQHGWTQQILICTYNSPSSLLKCMNHVTRQQLCYHKICSLRWSRLVPFALYCYQTNALQSQM